VRFAIANGGGSWNERNLPYQAATAQAFGLTADEALAAITLAPALILGVADRAGALAPGKDATLIVTDGDVLEESSHVLSAWIEGRAVDLTDRQKVLAAKYREKYRRLGAPGATSANP
jgi:imidazolonepropionase-like amidohydrolase